MATVANRPFAEIRVEDSANLSRTLTTHEIALFAAASGDLNPIHVDDDYAREHADGPVVGHSLWGGALVSNLLGNVLPGPGTRYLEQNLRFERPPELGDTLTVSVTVRAKHADAGTVDLDCLGVNQRGEGIFTGTAVVLAPTEKVVTERVEAPFVAVGDHEGYEQLIERCADLEPLRTAVVHPCERSALKGALDAAAEGLIDPILIGPEARIREVAEEAGLDLDGFSIVDTQHSHASAATAVAKVLGGEAEVLMKGSLHTDELMAAIVARSGGLRTERRISHAFVMDVPTYPRPLIVTDAAINIFPKLEAKRDICQNAIDLARILGNANPKVAILSAVETVTPHIPSTIDAAALCKMAGRGQITGGLVDGPLAMDNAISEAAARIKGIDSPVAGKADILLAPDLEAGNILAKQLTFLAGADAAGIVLGARVPVVLTSRADNVRTRMASCAVALMLAHGHRGMLGAGDAA